MNLAIVHDYLNQYGGAEKVVETLHELFPEAPIFTSIYLPEKMPESFKKMDIRTSFMQRLPFLDKHFKKYLMLYPKAFESFDLREYDVVLSSSSAFAKGVKCCPGSTHICYCHTPMRFVWDYDHYVDKENFNVLTRKMLPFFISFLKRWDVKTNTGINSFVAVSKSIQERIKKCYNLESTLIYPPVNVKHAKISLDVSNYFLVVSRLNPYKRIDLAIEAFNQLGLPLKIVGDGPQKKSLQAMARPNIEFVGKVTNEALPEIMSHCQALIFPGKEDFGIVPVEAQACGRPVIAFASGGALETVIEGVTGLFFKEATVESLVRSIRKFDSIKNTFNPSTIRNNALRFDEAIFKKTIKKFVEKKLEDSRGGR